MVAWAAPLEALSAISIAGVFPADSPSSKTVAAGAEDVVRHRELQPHAMAAGQYCSGFSRASPFINFSLIALEVRERKNLIKEG